MWVLMSIVCVSAREGVVRASQTSDESKTAALVEHGPSIRRALTAAAVGMLLGSSVGLEAPHTDVGYEAAAPGVHTRPTGGPQADWNIGWADRLGYVWPDTLDDGSVSPHDAMAATLTTASAGGVGMASVAGGHDDIDDMDWVKWEENVYPWVTIARTFLQSAYGRTDVAVPAIEGLVRLMENDEAGRPGFPPSLRVQAVRTFEKLAYSFDSSGIRGAATKALGRVAVPGSATDSTIQALAGKLDSRSDEGASQPAFDALVRLYPQATKEQQGFILRVVEETTHSWQSDGHRAAAVKALSEIAMGL